MKDIGRLLAIYRKKAKLTQPELAEELKKDGVEIGFRSISTWEKNVCEPSVTVFLHMCKILKVPDVMEDYFGDNINNPMRNLNDDGRNKVYDYISLLEDSKDGRYLKDTATMYRADSVSDENVIDPKAASSIIRLYDNRVSAGTGNFLESDSYEEVDRKEYNVPSGADFGVRISGDSMQPRYMDGQIVWVHKQDNLNAGDIGIFDLNGECFCKKLSYEDDKPQLISLNKKYSPKVVQESDSFMTFGRVLN